MKAKEIEPEITEKEYEEVLDDIYGDVTICGMNYSSGMALREIDPTAFRCGKIDYEDTLDHEWKCSECEAIYKTEEEAEDCCKPEEEE